MASVHITVRDFKTEIPGELVDGITWRFPEIESVNAHGRPTKWIIYVRVVRPDGTFVPIADELYVAASISPLCGWINTDSFIIEDGVPHAPRETVPTIVRAGKNIGRKGATNEFTQALRDAYGTYNKQKTKASSATRADFKFYPPMLARVFEGAVEFPAWVQRKYNGLRAVSTLDNANQVVMYSRSGKVFPGMTAVRAELAPVLRMFQEEGRELYIDGEIYKHGAPLQVISGDARRGAELDYMVYDIFIANEPDMLYAQRLEILEGLFEDLEFKRVMHVQTLRAGSMPEITALYEQFLREDYEGAMIRTNGIYEYSYNGYRGTSLLKLKPTLDAEYEVVGWTTGRKGKAAQALMIICKVGDAEFPVTPAMKLPVRIAMAQKMGEVEPNGRTHFENHWLGKKIIVEYGELSRDGLPQRAVTHMVVRDWE